MASKNRKSRSKAQKYGNPAKRAAVQEAERSTRDSRASYTGLPGRGSAGPRSLSELAESLGLGSRPERTADWFAGAHETVRAGAKDLLAARSSREVVTGVGQLFGEVFHDAVHGHSTGLFFEEFAGEVFERSVTALAHGDDDGSLARLLYGMTAIALPDDAADLWSDYTAALGTTREFPAEPWLLQRPHFSATGQLWQSHDAWGGARRCVIAEVTLFEDTFYYAWDIDQCAFPTVINAGAFDDVASAHSAWQAWVGAAAAGSRPEPVDTVEWGLLYRDPLVGIVGDETRPMLDQWFATHRLARAVGERLGTDPGPVTGGDHQGELDAFVAWYETEHGTALTAQEREYADGVAEYWCDQVPPSTWTVISPHRVGWNVTGMADWFDDEWAPKMIGLLPAWIRFQGGRGDATPDQIERAVAVARGGTVRAADQCASTTPP